MPLTLSELMLYGTTKLTRYNSGGVIGSGTGFVYNTTTSNEQHVPLIITNKHVLEGADQIGITFHVADVTGTTPVPSGRTRDILLTLSSRGVVAHPDPEVDLCGLGIGDLLTEMQKQGNPIFTASLTRENIPDDTQWQNFDAIEDVIMVGCPNGLYDAVNKLPIVRAGITATHLAKQYAGKNVFIVDMACFPGSSGSPVFLSNSNPYVDRQSGNFVMGGTRFFFLGVLYAGPTISNAGEIVMANNPSVQFSSMMHLGYVVRSTEVLVLETMVESINAARTLAENSNAAST